MQPRPNVAFCPVCRTPKRPNEVACSQCGTRSCPSGHVIDSRICRQCGFEDRSWRPPARAPSLEATVQRSQGIPEVTEGICPRCRLKTLFTYGRCHNCGFILETGQRLETQQETGGQFSAGAQHYVVQQQFPGTHDAKLAYICPRCGARADPRTGSCHNCGYIGALAYEMPKQQSPGTTPPPAPVKAPIMKEPGFTGQQYSHPQEPLRPCPACGAAVPADSRFCRQCGFRSTSSRHVGSQGYVIGAAEKARGSVPMGMSQMTPSMGAMSPGGTAQDSIGTYIPQTGGYPYPVPEIEYPEQKVRVREKREKEYPQERKAFPTGLLVAVFVVAAALVAMIMFTVSQILAPPPPLPTAAVDKTPPEITNVTVSNITTSSVTIEWTTNEKATSQIMLCDPSGVCTWTEPDATLVKSHSVLVNNIKLNTKYHVTIKSMDASGNEGTHEMDQTFTQAAQPPPTPPPPTVPEGIEVGLRARDFTLKNLEGTDITLSSYRGKIVMVNFWRVDCPPCITEMPHLQSVYTTYTTKPLVVLAVNLSLVTGMRQEDTTIVQPFRTANNYTFPILLDSNGAVKAAYNISSWPQTFFIDSTGIIRNIKRDSFASKEEIVSIINTLQ